jgi:hypothetical protein
MLERFSGTWSSHSEEAWTLRAVLVVILREADCSGPGRR